MKTQTTGFHFVCAVFGVFTTLLAFVSYLIKERLYISDSFLSFVVGAIVGPATGLFDLGAVWGGIVGYASAKLLKLCRRIQYVDHESFFAFPILMAILLIGTCGMAGSNNILASSFAGNALSWDG